MALINPLYTSILLQEAESPPRDSPIDSFNANNVICSGTNNTLTDCRRCTIINSDRIKIEEKYNTHCVGSLWFNVELENNNRLFILCDNGMNVSSLNRSIFVANSSDITTEGDVIASSLSDERLKTNVLKINNSLGKLKKINAVSFEWNNKQSSFKGRDIGLIAQEVESVFPSLVKTRDSGTKCISYKKMVAILVACIKEKQKKINKIKQLIEQTNESR